MSESADEAIAEIGCGCIVVVAVVYVVGHFLIKYW